MKAKAKILQFPAPKAAEAEAARKAAEAEEARLAAREMLVFTR